MQKLDMHGHAPCCRHHAAEALRQCVRSGLLRRERGKVRLPTRLARLGV